MNSQNKKTKFCLSFATLFFQNLTHKRLTAQENFRLPLTNSKSFFLTSPEGLLDVLVNDATIACGPNKGGNLKQEYCNTTMNNISIPKSNL